MALSRFVLNMVEGIERPAIAAPMPTASGGQTMMLDLGANVGEFSRRFATLVGPEGYVLAVEPDRAVPCRRGQTSLLAERLVGT
jgi:hypothetical protein